MRHRVPSATPGLNVVLAVLGTALTLLLGIALLPPSTVLLLVMAAVGIGLRRVLTPLHTPRARYERRHLRLAGPRPGAWLG